MEWATGPEYEHYGEEVVTQMEWNCTHCRARIGVRTLAYRIGFGLFCCRDCWLKWRQARG
jgi:hypothetical protein